MKFFLRYVSSPEVGMSECVKLAQKLDYCVVNDANQLFAVGMELLGAAKKVNPASELVVNNSKEGVLAVMNGDDKVVAMAFHPIRHVLEEMSGDELPAGFLEKIDKGDVVQESLDELRNEKGELLLCDFEYIEEYIRAVRELLEDDGKWDTSSMIDALADATRLVNGLLGSKKGGLK